jgi:GMP synthase-like glutamine amidotransferase
MIYQSLRPFRRIDMDKTILIVKHIEQEGPGLIGQFFRDDGWELRTIELGNGEKLPDSLHDISAVIILGGPMNVDEEDLYPFLKEEEKLIRKALIEEIPMLGICLGAQLIAKTCSAAVTKASEKEIGWYHVTLTEEGQKDSLFRGLPKNIPVFQWHEDTLELPANGVLLAQSKKCRNQAFRIGNNVYGLQFHVEVTDDMIEAWMKDEAGKVNIEKIMSDTQRVRDDFEQQAKQIFLNFKSLVESELRIKRVMELFVEDEKKAKKKKLLWWDTKEHDFMAAKCT